MQKLILITDFDGIFNVKPDPLKPNQSHPLLYSAKGVNIRICPKRLKEFRDLSKQFDLKIVINPRKWTKLTILDFKDMFKTFNINHEIIDIVDMTLFGAEEEMAPVFRAQEYITYHIKSHEKYQFLLSPDDVDLDSKLKYIQKHLGQLAENTKVYEGKL